MDVASRAAVKENNTAGKLKKGATTPSYFPTSCLVFGLTKSHVMSADKLMKPMKSPKIKLSSVLKNKFCNCYLSRQVLLLKALCTLTKW